jgi:hypothetical protein
MARDDGDASLTCEAQERLQLSRQFRVISVVLHANELRQRVHDCEHRGHGHAFDLSPQLAEPVVWDRARHREDGLGGRPHRLETTLELAPLLLEGQVEDGTLRRDATEEQLPSGDGPRERLRGDPRLMVALRAPSL